MLKLCSLGRTIPFTVFAVFLLSACTSTPPRGFDVIPEDFVEASRAADAEISRASMAEAVEAAPSDVAAASETTAIFPGFLPKEVNEIRLHSLPVGAGSCHLIECPGNTAPIIYDCGSINDSPNSMTPSQIRSYFDQVLSRYSEPPIVIVSHSDQDHYNLVPEALGATEGDEGRAAATIWLGGRRLRYQQDGFDQWLQNQENRGVSVEVGLNRFPPGFDNGTLAVPELDCGTAETFIMTANIDDGGDANARSFIVRIEYNQFVITLAGDAHRKTEEAALSFPRTDTTVLTGSHHGASSHQSNHPTWAKKTEAEVAIFSAGDQFKHPRCSSMLNYVRTGSLDSTSPHRIRCGKRFGGYTDPFFVDRAEYVTETSGAILVTSDGSATYEIDCFLEPNCG